MDLDELLEILEIDDRDDFMYFDQFAGLMEYEGDLDEDTFADVIDMASSESLYTMTKSFFDDLISGIPDDNTDLYASMNEERDILASLAGSEERRDRSVYTDELYNFRKWYFIDKSVEVTMINTGVTMNVTVAEALTLFRIEKLSGDKYNYDFSQSMPYEADEYAVYLASQIEENDEVYHNFSAHKSGGYDTMDEYDLYDVEELSDLDFSGRDHYHYVHGCDCGHDHEDDCGCGHDHEHHHYHDDDIDPYTDGLIDRYAPVIDGPDCVN